MHYKSKDFLCWKEWPSFCRMMEILGIIKLLKIIWVLKDTKNTLIHMYFSGLSVSHFKSHALDIF